jgi:hypothetical protein
MLNMKYRTRTFYSETQKAMMWDRWRPGETLHDIARLFDRHHTSVGGILVRTGGIRPAQRVRSSRVLSLSEREEISRGVIASRSMRSIAASLGRAPSSVSRELRRAVFHVNSSGKNKVGVDDVLVAIFSEKQSHAVFLLQRAGVTRIAVVNYVMGLKPPP